MQTSKLYLPTNRYTLWYSICNRLPLNLRINVHKRGKSGCETYIDHYTNVFKNATFSIQMIEKLRGNDYESGIRDNAMLEYRLIQMIERLPGNGYENGIKDNAMLEYRLQR